MSSHLNSDSSGQSVNGLLRNMICGMSTILVIAPAKRVEALNIDNYMHHSAEEAIHSDWMKVGRGFTDSASDVRDNAKRVEQSS